MYHPDNSKSVALFEIVSEVEAAQINGGVGFDDLVPSDLAASAGIGGGGLVAGAGVVAPPSQASTNRNGGSKFNPAMIMGFVQQFAQPSPYLQDPQVQAAIGSFFQGLFGGGAASS